jgi:predicted Zn-dependent protease
MIGRSIDAIATFDAAARPGSAEAEAAKQHAVSDALASANGTAGTDGPANEGVIWAQPVVTWTVEAIAGNDVLSAAADATVAQAMAIWQEASGVTFEQVADPSSADIVVDWNNLNSGSTDVLGFIRYAFDDGLLQSGVTVRLEDPAGDPLVAGADGQLTYSGAGSELLQLALHEVGHALGLADNSDPNSVMYYALSANNLSLDATDVREIQGLYGPPSASASRTRLASAGPGSRHVITPRGIRRTSTARLERFRCRRSGQTSPHPRRRDIFLRGTDASDKFHLGLAAIRLNAAERTVAAAAPLHRRDDQPVGSLVPRSDGEHERRQRVCAVLHGRSTAFDASRSVPVVLCRGTC